MPGRSINLLFTSVARTWMLRVVVTAGQLKLHNGSLIQINNSLQPSDSPNPNPPNE